MPDDDRLKVVKVVLDLARNKNLFKRDYEKRRNRLFIYK